MNPAGTTTTGTGTEAGTNAGSGIDDSTPVDDAKTYDADYVRKLRQESARYRTEAKANAEAAARLAELEEAQKSKEDKLADAAAAAAKEAAEAKAEALRWRIAAKHRIDDADAELFLTGTDEATLTKQAERLVARDADQKKNGNVARREGTGTNNQSNAEDPMRAFAREVFGDRRTPPS